MADERCTHDGSNVALYESYAFDRHEQVVQCGQCFAVLERYVDGALAPPLHRPLDPPEEEWGPDSATQELERGPR